MKTIALDQNEQEPTPNLRLRQRQPTSTLVLAAHSSRQLVCTGTQTLASILYDLCIQLINSDRVAEQPIQKLSDI